MHSLLSGDWLSMIHVLGAVQGIFLAVILASKRRNTVANRLLAVAMFAFSMELLTTVYHTLDFDDRWPHFIGVTYPFPFLFAPLLYLYARTVSEGGHVFRRAYYLHFIPLALVVLYMVPFYLQTGAEKIAVVHAPENHPWTPSLTWINYFKFVYTFCYLVLIIWVLHRHRKRIQDTFSSIEHINLAWLRNMIIGGAALWGISLAIYVFGLVGTDGKMDPIEGYDDFTALGIAVYVYAIGYLGLRQPEIFAPRTKAPTPDRPTDAVPSAAPEPPEQDDARLPDAKPQYARSGMEPAIARRHVQALLDLMEREKPFTRNDLTLQDLADTLAISPHNLSEVINTQIGKNFYDFVNGYRVAEVQRRLADPGSDNLTLLAIGLDAGFNSKSSFNAVFKKLTAMTPSEYRQHIRNTSAESSLKSDPVGLDV